MTEQAVRITHVVLADDHAVVRSSLKVLVERELGADVLEAGNATDAVAWALDPRVGLALLDVRLGELDGLWALDEIRRQRPDLPVVMFSTYADPDLVADAMEGGAGAYLLKGCTTDELREAVEAAVGGGDPYLHPTAARALAERRPQVQHGARALNERELQILVLAAEGASDEAIGASLHLSERAVASHLNSVCRKLGVSGRTQAVARARRERIVPG